MRKVYELSWADIQKAILYWLAKQEGCNIGDFITPELKVIYDRDTDQGSIECRVVRTCVGNSQTGEKK